jgi:hypothetical protein
MAEPSPLETPEWKSQSDLEQKEGLRKYSEFLATAQEITDRAPELEAHLWWEWAGRATLLVVAVLGWLYLATLPRVSTVAVALTTGVLVVGQIVVYWSVYSDLVQSWVAGHSGVKYLPWANVLPMLYLLFVLPSLLLLATVIAFRLSLSPAVHAK